ncbi:glycosyltransferase family 39 protein [Stigmatella erecta]|uniref:Dolichyl-diphosphooligosaccharide--protein glycosyltransferase n=1 Tax=Stigmatella erecta TaxID=83460 RepID=A0A1I0FW16_9BACT|nr:glycosyltransferase family 39 protein [Stigmatella erecta]SET62726.1 dolichyl-diphosphooligosaccharide--protein glycosyltransferase [Stigmatella erecta]
MSIRPQPADPPWPEAPVSPPGGAASAPRRTAGLGFWIGWGALLALAFLARIANWRQVFLDGNVELLATDSHYYVRYALLQLQTFPSFHRFDPYISFPSGASIIWPPLHTWLVALFIALGSAEPERAVAWVGPLVALVELGLLTLLARRWLGGKVALGALGMLALVPAAVTSGGLGNADHHVHEPTLAALSALLLGRALAQGSTRLGAATGVALGLGRMFTTTSFTLVPGMAAAIPLAALLLRKTPGATSRVGLAAGAGLALSQGLAVVWFGDPTSLAYYDISLFQPLFGLCLFWAGAGVAAFLEHRRTWPVPLGIAALCALPLAAEVLQALGHLALKDPLLNIVAESIPLWQDWEFARQLLGAMCMLLPLSLVAASLWVWLERDVMTATLVAGTLPLTVASLLQARFTQPLMGCGALLTAAGLGWALRLATPRIRRVSYAVLGLVGLSFLASLVPLRRLAAPTDEGLIRATLAWMKTHTPPPSSAWNTQVPPAYGVVAYFNLGHLLTLWAERPAVATPFSQAPVHIQANLAATGVLSAKDEETAYARAQALSTRYLLIIPIKYFLGELKVPPSQTVNDWLLEHAGMTHESRPASSHFRLIHESAASRLHKPALPYARLFELVPGAELRGRCNPGAAVSARLELTTPRGPLLHYTPQTTADTQGAFSLRVAYPTEGDPAASEIRAAAAYQVTCDGGGGTATVSEDAVRAGTALELDGPP